jgi:hypothetical protein
MVTGKTLVEVGLVCGTHETSCHGFGLLVVMPSGRSDKGLPDGEWESAMDAEFDNIEDLTHRHMRILDSFTTPTQLPASINISPTLFESPSRHRRPIAQQCPNSAPATSTTARARPARGSQNLDLSIAPHASVLPTHAVPRHAAPNAYYRCTHALEARPRRRPFGKTPNQPCPISTSFRRASLPT